MTTSSPSGRNPQRRKPAGAPALLRGLGRWDLTAIGINMVIGAGIFLVPAEVAGDLGAWSPLAYVLLGLFSLLIGLCFAEVGSRFEGTGGPYLYARAAFGRFVAFEVGWMYWFTRVTGQASVTAGLVLAIGFYWPSAVTGLPRVLIITVLTLLLTVVNVRGIRPAAWLVDLLTAGKLIPLLVFIGVGLFFIRPGLLVPTKPIPWSHMPSAMLLLLFIFSGYEVIPVPAGESEDPRRHVPFAIVVTILSVTVINIMVHVVAAGTLATLASVSTPLANAAAVFMGSAGALMMGIATVVSITGNTAGQILTSSRMLFALAENGDLLPYFGKIHRAYRTPANAIIFSAAAAWALALSGSFVELVAASATARLIVYASVCGSAIIFRSHRHNRGVSPATFHIPFGRVIPVIALLASALMILGISKSELLVGASGLLAGVVLFLISTFMSRRNRPGPSDRAAPTPC